MKAAAFASFGGPEVMSLMEFPEPQAGPGQVRVRVKSAGVQHFDSAVRSGWKPAYGLEVKLPQIPGNEFAGIVDQVGEGVTGFSLGSRVLGFSLLNSYAEYVVVGADQIVSKPDTLSWEEAGGLTGNGQGAHIALNAIGIGPGDTVLINGAAGSLGSFAVQLAKEWGAKTVIGTASEGNHDFIRSLGAIPVTYEAGLADRLRQLAPDGIHAAFDTAGGEGLLAAVELVKDRNRICTYFAYDLVEELGLRVVRGERSAARLAELVELHTQGRLQIHIRQVFPLSQAGEAQRALETRHGRGKIVLRID
ncbi:NADP-dependent oxidoreductase [Paenibacillus mucilaginosus]|uniref:Alcohol dehydrogenase zinc-binding domain protein n=1 Tax=Paenibacillus mucilaginosus (strain KNP414) TaxID=1036673 RepID=F8FHZ6_PAEMK|nr:NADP-dependent oxidoreductase [Paenibacillus mucilaginosus]AEI43338.1 Alcohol dehydrogenase zinc-binding domain protein [Paenibacillus mucilaginosus KNP414]MCG7212110.1 NADP-dependent oxidoreductase [Paenibacillus mucilaginosus]WDM24915.1 NADP-dependent oxidoreductase [Paenibacillus mucilaginosus]